MTHQSFSIHQTKKIAAGITADLGNVNVIALSGDLGSGKTHFTKGVAEYLGIKNEITSPTFVLMKVYETKDKKFKRLVHIDAYRLTSADELEALGVDEYFADPATLTVIEWAEKIKNLLPQNRQEVFLKSVGESEREIKIK
jgi:tRNA threonylcarbamoyladenosine biosynthesis protein TsaE